jgi:3-oxoacyl-[acyl-carrier protein] reductase
MHNILSLEGHIALVTGAGQGVGRQTSLHFAANGCSTVIVNDYHADRARTVAKEVEALGAKAIVVACDITDYADLSRRVAEAVRQAGGLHIVVNNAGNAGPTTEVGDLPAFWETEPAEWNRWLATNLYGVMNTSRIAVPLIIKTGAGGSIVNVISDAGRVGEPNLVVYSAAKAGAAGFSRALAKSVGAHNIRVNSISLASINTPGLQGLLSDETLVKRMLKQYIVRRVGEPTDAANMILFLASEAASWISGQTYPVNGGYSTSQ